MRMEKIGTEEMTDSSAQWGVKITSNTSQLGERKWEREERVIGVQAPNSPSVHEHWNNTGRNWERGNKNFTTDTETVLQEHKIAKYLQRMYITSVLENRQIHTGRKRGLERAKDSNRAREQEREKL